MTLLKPKVCRACGGLAINYFLCEDCESELGEGRIQRKKQPTDPTIYVPDLNGMAPYETEE